jgi:hypothetical protein
MRSLFQFPQGSFCVDAKKLASLGENDFPTKPIEEARAQLVFEATDLDRQRRL